MSNILIPYKCFPPPSNKDYALTSDGRDPSLLKRPLAERTMWEAKSIDNAIIKDGHHSQVPQANMMSKPKLDADALAATINWNLAAFMTETCESNGPIYPPEQARADFVKMINEGAELIYCKVCGKDHIPPGPPITIADRDACGSELPKWYHPKPGSQKPWDQYFQLMDLISHLSRYESDPTLIWERQNHPADDKWSCLGRQNGGWWKCRQGSDAFPAEISCELCHKIRTAEEFKEEQREMKVRAMEELGVLRALVERWKGDWEEGEGVGIMSQSAPAPCSINPSPSSIMQYGLDSDDDNGPDDEVLTTDSLTDPDSWKVGDKKAAVDENTRGSESPELKPTELHQEMSALNLDELADGTQPAGTSPGTASVKAGESTSTVNIGGAEANNPYTSLRPVTAGGPSKYYLLR